MDRLSKITQNGKALFLAYDQGLEHGPTDLNDHNVDPEYIFRLAVQGKFTAVITHRGIAEMYYSSYKRDIPLILKVNGKTKLGTSAAFSPLLCDVKEAIQLGASAIGYTVYQGSDREGEMLQTLAQLISDAHRYKIPVIGWMYPRGGIVKDDENRDIVAYAARVGFELGCDMVKVKYPGSLESMKWVIRCAQKTHVVVAGGNKADDLSAFYSEMKTIMQAGATGLAVGRNVWQQLNPLGVAAELNHVVMQ